jgi:uncharacterized protein (UPF0305 family)
MTHPSKLTSKSTQSMFYCPTSNANGNQISLVIFCSAASGKALSTKLKNIAQSVFQLC